LNTTNGISGINGAPSALRELKGGGVSRPDGRAYQMPPLRG
jgi:hypothetical protein